MTTTTNTTKYRKNKKNNKFSKHEFSFGINSNKKNANKYRKNNRNKLSKSSDLQMRKWERRPLKVCSFRKSNRNFTCKKKNTLTDIESIPEG